MIVPPRPIRNEANTTETIHIATRNRRSGTNRLLNIRVPSAVDQRAGCCRKPFRGGRQELWGEGRVARSGRIQSQRGPPEPRSPSILTGVYRGRTRRTHFKRIAGSGTAAPTVSLTLVQQHCRRARVQAMMNRLNPIARRVLYVV